MEYILSLLAGILTTLSPCVLPILPLIIGGALQKNKAAPLWMGLGLMLSFTIVGVSISRFGTLLGIDTEGLRELSAYMLLASALFLLVPQLSGWLAVRLSILTSHVTRVSTKFDEGNILGAFVIGVLLGIIWTPCVGPTLGVAISLATQEGELLKSILMMWIFSFGATTPLTFIAYGSRQFVMKNRSKILNQSKLGKQILAVVLALTAILILSGGDKLIEAKLLEVIPAEWVDLTTKF